MAALTLGALSIACDPRPPKRPLATSTPVAVKPAAPMPTGLTRDGDGCLTPLTETDDGDAGILAAGRRLSADDLLRAPCDHLAYDEAVRLRLEAALAPFPAVPLDVELGPRTREDDGLVRQELRYTTSDGLRALVVVLRPDDDVPRPTVYLLHGHDHSNAYFTTITGKPGWGLGRLLARAGFVTASPDLRSFGAFKMGGRPHAGRNSYIDLVASQGDVYARLAVNDTRRGLAAVRTLPFVDGERVGLLGISLGGWLALVTAAVDVDVKATVIANMFVDFSRLYSSAHEKCQHIKGIKDVVTAPELALSILPRDLQIFWGGKDPFYLPHNGKQTTAALTTLAARAGASQHLDVQVTPGLGHTVDASAHLPFFEERLGPVPTPPEERAR